MKNQKEKYSYENIESDVIRSVSTMYNTILWRMLRMHTSLESQRNKHIYIYLNDDRVCDPTDVSGTACKVRI